MALRTARPNGLAFMRPMALMRLKARALALAACLAGITSVFAGNSRSVAQPATLPTPGFHHLHLNSVNPEAAIAFYVRQFPSTSASTFAGQPALQIAEQRVGALHESRSAAGDAAADGVLAFRMACHRRAQEPRGVQTERRHAASALHRRRRRHGVREQRYLARHRRRARAHASRHCRSQGQGREASRRRRVRVSSRSGRRDGGVPGEHAGRAVQSRAHVSGSAVLRAAVVPDAAERCTSAAAVVSRPERKPIAVSNEAPTRRSPRSNRAGCTARPR